MDSQCQLLYLRSFDDKFMIKVGNPFILSFLVWSMKERTSRKHQVGWASETSNRLGHLNHSNRLGHLEHHIGWGI